MSGTPLQAAVLLNLEEVALRFLTLLLNNGADINGQGGDTRNVLQAAVIRGNKGIVEMLLKFGANFNGGGGEYESPLITAVTCRGKVMMKLLLDNGANINMQSAGRIWRLSETT